jgi:hypothetical protein
MSSLNLGHGPRIEERDTEGLRQIAIAGYQLLRGRAFIFCSIIRIMLLGAFFLSKSG